MVARRHPHHRRDILSVRRLRSPCLRLRPIRPAPARQAALAGDRGALTNRTPDLKSGSHGAYPGHGCPVRLGELPRVLEREKAASTVVVGVEVTHHTAGEYDLVSGHDNISLPALGARADLRLTHPGNP